MGNQLMCYGNHSPEDYPQNNQEFIFNFSKQLAHSDIIVQQNFVIQQKQNINGLSQVALIHPKLPSTDVSFQLKIRNGAGVKVGIAQKDIIEKNKFEIDQELNQYKEHGFYVIDSDGYYYKNNFSGKISTCGFNFNDENVIVGVNWEPVYLFLFIQQEKRIHQLENKKSQQRLKFKISQKDDVFKMQVDQIIFKEYDFHPCVIFGQFPNQIEILRVSYHS